MLSEINQSQKTYTAWFHLNEVSKIVKLIETESRMVVARGYGEREKGNLCSMGITFHTYKMNKF